jgi:ABC-2 type transport system ATP-binding protein
VSDAAIAVADLRVVRGGFAALDGVSLTVAPGRVTGLLGPSGSGKSTLIRSIVGVQRIESGTVEVLGLPAGSAPLRRRVAYLTQTPAVYADLTVRENLRFFARVLDLPESAIDEAIADVDMLRFANRAASRVSGGQRARIGLATALLGRPEVIVLDEPTVGLDPVLRRDLWALFRRLADEGATLLVSSHVMDEADRCQELLLLREGKLLATGTADELRERTGERDLDTAFLRLIEERAA